MPVDNSIPIHGKAAIVYVGANGGPAQFLASQLEWSLDYDQALVDVSPLNNKFKRFVKGMIGWTFTGSGNFDDTSNVLFNASLSDVVEQFYLYPNSAKPNSYYFGTAWIALGKIASGSTTSKASTSFKATGDGTLFTH